MLCAAAHNTYVGTWAGTVYTALVIDAFSRMIVGWRTAGHHRVTLVLDALVMAVAARRRQGRSAPCPLLTA